MCCTAALLLAAQPEDLTAILIVSTAEVLGLVFSLLMVHYLGRKTAFAVPLGLIAVVLVPMMAGERGQRVDACREMDAPRWTYQPRHQIARNEQLCASYGGLRAWKV